MTLIPSSRPKQLDLETLNILGGHGVLDHVALLGVRGFFGHSNTYGTYDDALFLKVRNEIIPFNFNTDPVRHRAGHGSSESSHGMATLKPGVWKYKLGMHRSSYEALVQAASVTVYRDADKSEPTSLVHLVDNYPVYEETGDFGIHIHHGGDSTVSSIGCQTIPPGSQWDEFIHRLKKELTNENQKVVPYCLISKS